MNGETKPASITDVLKYDDAVRAIRILRERGFEALLAGGCVRDILLRRRPQDYDIATDARPEQVKEAFERTVAVGEKFGVIKVLVGGAEFEVATFRADAAYEDGRRPKAVRFTKACEDALRRDFTINGLFYDPIEGTVIDYVEGRRDLQKRLIRAIGDPGERFAEDYLRMLRAVRFAVTLDFSIESQTLAALRANAASITRISGERIRGELEVLLTHPARRRALELMDQTGLLVQILPEIAATKGVKQGRRLHPEGDVWQHSLLSVEHLEDPSFVLAMAVLLHDVGKPVTAAVWKARLFADHERVGEKMARQIAQRLRLSKRETETIAFLVRYHMLLKDVTNMRKSTLKRLISHEFFDELLEVHRIDAVASNRDLSNYEFAVRAAEELSKEQIKPDPLVNGHDLAAIGVAPGPLMGAILDRLYTAQLEEELATREEALALARKLAEEGAKE